MRRLLVTGASGLLGLTLSLQVSASGRREVIGQIHHNGLPSAPFETRAVDLTAPGEAVKLLESSKPDAVIHCAAQANIDACETQPDLALRLNAEVPGEMAAWAEKNGVPFLHVSTDAVFDGARGGYTETDAPNPLSQYARTKLAGEQAVLSANPYAAVARVVFYGWSLSGRRSLAEWFINNLRAGNQIKGFTDAMFRPLLVNDLADILLKMVDGGLSGIYHVVSSETISKYEFGVRLARRFVLDERLIQPASVNDGGLAARRSPRLDLNCDKLAAEMGAPLPDQETGIERFYALYTAGWPESLRALAMSAK